MRLFLLIVAFVIYLPSIFSLHGGNISDVANTPQHTINQIPYEKVIPDILPNKDLLLSSAQIILSSVEQTFSTSSRPNSTSKRNNCFEKNQIKANKIGGISRKHLNKHLFREIITLSGEYSHFRFLFFICLIRI